MPGWESPRPLNAARIRRIGLRQRAPSPAPGSNELPTRQPPSADPGRRLQSAALPVALDNALEPVPFPTTAADRLAAVALVGQRARPPQWHYRRPPSAPVAPPTRPP